MRASFRRRVADRVSMVGITIFVAYVAYLTFDAFFKAYRATY